MSIIVSPSLLSANFANLQSDLDMINRSEAEWLHIDIMDGVFVPNISFGPPVLQYVAEGCTKALDVHLMVVNPMNYLDAVKALGAKVYVSTVDGSYGTKGFVTDVLKNLEYDYFYTCGPMPMFKAIEKIATTSGQYSFEERMGCGFGACMGCSCKTKYGYKRICRDGPVLEREEIIW